MAWADLELFKARIGVTTCDNNRMLQGILSGVEKTIQNAIASPVELTLIENEWRAPTDDPRLVLRWRPVNVENEDNGTDNPVVLVCDTSYNAATGKELIYGTDYVVWGLGDDDPSFSLTPMLETSNGAWSGWGGIFGWGGQWVRPPERLAATRTSDRGRVNVTYWAGWPPDLIPETIVEAAYLEAASLYAMRRMGRFLSSESLNGYSYSTAPIPQPFPGMSAKFTSPAAAAMLSQYIMPAVAGVEPW